MGNKNDDPERKVVETEDAYKFAGQMGIQLFETSAKENVNVEEVRPAPEGMAATGTGPGAPGQPTDSIVVAATMEGLLCAPGSAPRHPPAGATSPLSGPEGEAASDVGLPPQPGAGPLGPPHPPLFPLPCSGFLSLDLGLQSSGGCPGQPRAHPRGAECHLCWCCWKHLGALGRVLPVGMEPRGPGG